jgi:AraC-like DNA-binding protein
MISFFDKEPLFSLIKDMYTAIGIRVSVFDDEYNVVAEYPVEAPALCALIRTTQEGREACRICDRMACERARKLRAPHIYECHAGIMEAITPIALEGGVLGYVIFAHMLPEENLGTSIEKICYLCSKYNLPADKVKEAAKELKTYSNKKIMASIRLLDASASYLQVKKLASWKKEDISRQLLLFIDNNLDRKITSEDICRHFYISRTKLYLIAMQSFGMSISRIILNRKIEKAKELLVNKELPEATIADELGFDYNYFCKVFKKETSLTPLQYRKQIKK